MKSLLFVIGTFIGCFAHGHAEHDHGTPMTHLIFSNGAIHAHATWLTGPEVSRESRLKLEWKNGEDHSPTEPPGVFEVVLWMPSMGHGSAPTHIQSVLDQNGQPLMGVYEISNIYFMMGGKWDINVSVTYQDGSKETQVIKVNLPTDGGGHHGQH